MFTETKPRPSRSVARRVLGSGLLDLLTGPHGVDRYTEIVNGAWTINEARAEIVAVERRTARSTTLRLRPNRAFAGFKAGQHINLAVEINGRRQIRPYSPACSQHAPDGCVELTIGLHDGGLMSTHLRDQAKVGQVVGLDSVGGDFVLPDTRPDRLLLIAGGSGITPIISMLRTLVDEGHTGEVGVLHYTRTQADSAYATQLEQLAKRNPNVRIVNVFTRQGGSRFGADHIKQALPDGHADAEIFACGPPSLLQAARDVCGADRVHSESFVPPVFAISESTGGRITFAGSGVDAIDDGRSLLDQAEAAGLTPESGCRMGICHSCTCRKTSGAVRNLITGAVSTADEEDVQICVSAPLGDVELAI